MGRTPCCDKSGLKRGPWTADEDELLVNYINKNKGHGSWRALPKLAGLNFFSSLCNATCAIWVLVNVALLRIKFLAFETQKLPEKSPF
jgi:hypothetical protein